MKKSIRKFISEGIGSVAGIGIAGGLISALLAVLYLVMQNNLFLIGVIVVSALTAIVTAAMSASAKGKLNDGVILPIEKMAKGEAFSPSANIPEELSVAASFFSSDDGNEAVDFITKIAEGDFTAEVPEKIKSGAMGMSFMKLSRNINRAFGSMYSNVEEVNNGGELISGASMTLSLGAAEQESTLGRLTSAVGQVKGTVMTNAENAREANRIVTSATNELETGTEHMKALVTAMDNINKSTEEITNFVRVIEDIAFQTNILALNSSVEAARAGEAGKGFAVVATEVKNLATRSQEAAQETTAVIEECVRNVQEGLQKTQRTAKSIAAVEEETKEISRLINIISLACNEQAEAIVKIDEDVERISTGVQSTSIAAQECVSSAQSLAARSGALKSEIGGFKFRNADDIPEAVVRDIPEAVEPEKAPEPMKPISRPAPAPKPAAPAPKPAAPAPKPAAPAPKPAAPAPKPAAPAPKPAAPAPNPAAPAPKPAAPAPKPAVPAPKPAAPAPKPSSFSRRPSDDSYANAEFVETPDTKY